MQTFIGFSVFQVENQLCSTSTKYICQANAKYYSQRHLRDGKIKMATIGKTALLYNARPLKKIIKVAKKQDHVESLRSYLLVFIYWFSQLRKFLFSEKSTPVHKVFEVVCGPGKLQRIPTPQINYHKIVGALIWNGPCKFID